jgi:putative aldouronate transport system substrate-binding protein
MGLSVSACGSNTPTASGSTAGDGNTTVQTASASGSSTAAVDGDLSELAEICKDPAASFADPITLNIGYGNLTFQGDETLEKNAWNDLYASLGLNVVPMYQSSEDTTSKLKEMVMTGDYPDIFYLDNNTYLDFVSQGLVTDITKYYDNGFLSDEATDYLNYDNMDTVKKGYIDGKIYGIPQLSDVENSTPALWIRKDWLDKLGLSEPKTLEELADVAKAFTTQDPDGNGVDDTYGFSMNGKDVSTGKDSSGVAANFNMVGQYPTGLRFIVDDGSIQWAGQNVDKMKYGLNIMQQMYKDGTIDPNFVSTDGTALANAFASGKVGMFIGNPVSVGSVYADALILNPDFKCEALAVPTSDVNPEGGVYLPSASLVYWCVSSKCEHPEALFKVYNLAMHYIAYCDNRTQEEAIKYDIGETGKYTGKGESIIGYIDGPHYNYSRWQKEHTLLAENGNGDTLPWTLQQEYGYEQFFVQNMANVASLSAADLDKWKTGAQTYSYFGDTDSGYGVWDKTKDRPNYNEAYNTIPSTAITANLSNLESLTAETLINIITGQAAPESYADFLEQWKSKGGQDILDTVTAWYAQNK